MRKSKNLRSVGIPIAILSEFWDLGPFTRTCVPESKMLANIEVQCKNKDVGITEPEDFGFNQPYEIPILSAGRYF